MESLDKLSSEELLARTRRLVEAERRVSVEVLQHLAEIERRRVYAKIGYASLWDYAIRELKYSESAAYRRISAMRALRTVPALEEKIREGAMSVTTVAQVQTFLKSEREQANRTYTDAEKTALFEKCENKSTREVTRELLAVSPLAVRVQKERAITENRTVISFVADPELISKIRRVRDLSAARLRNPGSYPELIGLMSEITLDELDPLRRRPKVAKAEGPGKPDRSVALMAPQPTRSVGRRVAPSLRARIWREFGGRCAYVDGQSGRRCEATFGLEIEHCKPHGMGGSGEAENLRLLCRAHNQWQAIRTYGLEKMSPYLKKS